MSAKKVNLGPELPEPIRIPSDQCVMLFGEREYHIHRGQAIYVYAKPTSRQQLLLWRYRNRRVELDAIEPPPIPDENPELSDEENTKLIAEALDVHRKATMQGYAILEDIKQGAYAVFADLFASWDWTDLKGKPRPPLDGTGGPFQDLCDEEITHLVLVALGGVSAELPNESSSTDNSGTS